VIPLESLSPESIKTLSTKELTQLAGQIRQFLIETVSETGGHIGANLGTVDLSIALHRSFSSPQDKLIWDTGHQGYTHKIITGRADIFPTLNTYGGMNRFVARTESEHDIIEASHAGTSISVALGSALSKRLKSEDGYAVAVIGDGALCEGLALEALNHAAAETDINLVLVLNDNGYAISPGFGALHNYLQSRKAGGNRPETLFASLGLQYIGPVDGHNIRDMLEAFELAKQSDGVPLVHIKSVKGYGLPAADLHPYRLHFSFPFDPKTGETNKGFANPSYQDAAAKVIGERMQQDKKLICITPSTLYATGLQPVFDRFPDRCFDPGMEEQHAMTMTVGFALEGYKPIIFYQSTFMQRAFDQLMHDVCYMNLPVLILAVRSGLSGYDNATHHGIYDFSYLRGLPNLQMMYPKDRFELERMIEDCLDSSNRPKWIGMPYGPVDEFEEEIYSESEKSFSQAQVLFKGSDLLMITVGHKYAAARKAAEALRNEGIDCGLVNLRYLKPLPEDQLVELMRSVPGVVSVEEATLSGGVGSAIAALILDRNLRCELLRIGIPDGFVEPGSNEELCKIYGLDSNGIQAKIKTRWFVNVLSKKV
jgi:1-deoxy-D-xylulose-5-phosphate synthase